MSSRLAGMWCPDCQARVDPDDAFCPDCSGPVLTFSHRSECRGREASVPKPEKPRTPCVPRNGVLITRSKKTTPDPLTKVCTRCQEVKKHQARENGKPRSYCPDCAKEYRKEHRKKNWQREKARNTWKNMIARCEDKTQGKGFFGIPSYRDYGAKGVKVSKRWVDPESGFENFIEDMGLPPHPAFTIDRTNPHRNYTRSNCRWVHPKTQRANRKNARWVEAMNPTTRQTEIKTLSDWQRVSGIDRRTIAARLDRGWSADRAVSEATPAMLEEVPF